VTLTAAQVTRLKAVFPDGVCDWSKPGVSQQAAISPLTFIAGPGGVPLPPAPVSQGCDDRDGRGRHDRDDCDDRDDRDGRHDR